MRFTAILERRSSGQSGGETRVCGKRLHGRTTSKEVSLNHYNINIIGKQIDELAKKNYSQYMPNEPPIEP